MLCMFSHCVRVILKSYVEWTRYYSDLQHRLGFQLARSPGNRQPPRPRREPRPLCREHGCPLARAARCRARGAKVFSLGGLRVRWRSAAGLAKPLRLFALDLTPVRFEHPAPTEQAFTAAPHTA